MRDPVIEVSRTLSILDGRQWRRSLDRGYRSVGQDGLGELRERVAPAEAR